jgi:hypothetical protein
METVMNRSLATRLAVALALSVTGICVTGAMADPQLPAGPPVAAVTVKPEPPKTGGVTAKGKDADLVCFYEEETGSRLGRRRTCMPRAQYLQRTKDAQEALDDLRKDRGLISK